MVCLRRMVINLQECDDRKVIENQEGHKNDIHMPDIWEMILSLSRRFLFFKRYVLNKKRSLSSSDLCLVRIMAMCIFINNLTLYLTDRIQIG